ncbi:MAG: TIGR04222 domain-containing membrane protein [Acidobacteriota bacterium]
MNPFELRGPEFIGLYIIVLAAACLLAYILRKSVKGVDRDFALRGASLDAYEAAYLSGGAKLATETAIATLLCTKAFRLSFVDNTLSAIAGAPRVSHPFEQTVYRIVESGEATTVKSIRTKAAATANGIATRLQALGLVINVEQNTRAQTLPVIILVMVFLFGAIKVLIGLSRNRPVGFLFVLCCLTALIAFFLYKSSSHRTKAGDDTFERLKRENSALESTAKSKPERLAAGDVALAMGLFGITALAFTDESWSVLKRQILPPVSVSSGGSSWSSSSCSSSSSCGSSGCGGGCGGGGCGGCGS